MNSLALSAEDAVAQVERQPRHHKVSYRPEVDGLRAIAVLAVIFYHAGTPFFSGGYVGVDIFFVISGYLISSIILSDIENARFSFIDFYERRIRRIFPALFLVLLVTTILAYFVHSPRQFKEFGQSLVATATFTSNIYFPMKIGYFAEDAHNVALMHMWSLSVEEQFYVVFPVILLVLARARHWAVTGAMAAVGVVSLAWAIHGAQTSGGSSFFWTHARAWELLAGAMIARNWQWLRAGLEGRYWLRLLCELVGAGLMIGSIFLVGEETAWPSLATVPVVAGTAMLVIASTGETPFGRLLALRAVVLVGLISYSAYLWHQPLFALSRVANGGPLGVGQSAILIALTLMLAFLSWRYVETPWRSRARFSRRTVFGAGALASAVAIAVGATLHLAQGLPQRYEPATRAVAATMQHSPFRDACHTDGEDHIGAERACRYFTPDARWAVFADSEGVELAYALAEMLRPTRTGVLHLTFSGCAAALSFPHPGPGCNAWTRDSLAYLERRPEITHVLITYRWSFQLFGDQLKTYPEMPDERPKFLRELPPEAARERFWHSFEEMVERLRRAGKQVVIVRPIPELPVPVERYIYGRREASDRTGMTRAETDARNAWINRRLDGLANLSGVTLIDPTQTLCDSQDCWSVVDGQSLYFDDNHLSVIGARRLLEDARRRGLIDLGARSPVRPAGVSGVPRGEAPSQ